MTISRDFHPLALVPTRPRRLTARGRLKIKGWPGPIIAQRDHYPASLPQPTTAADKRAIAGARFNSELAFFLLVASERDFWVFSWFWSWYDYIPGNVESTVPTGFFPEAECAVGAPKGRATRNGNTYRREFEHAHVYVDLEHRNRSKVTFAKCQ